MQRALVASIALAAAMVVAADTLDAQGNGRGPDYFTNLPVVTQDGTKLRFYDDLIKEKIVLINFIYTNCPDICPLTTARLVQVQEKLGEAVGRDIFFYSITVDPEHDSPERLKTFAEAFHVGPGWLFLTGRSEDIRTINSKFGERSRNLNEHRQGIVLGNDATGEWTRNSPLGDLERLVMDIRAMDPKWRGQVRAPQPGVKGDALYRLSKEPGQALFRKLCSACHTIGVGDRVGPDLLGVTARRRRDWLTNFIADPYKMRRDKDPIALDLATKYPGAIMPRLGLGKNDAEDLITYLAAQTARLSGSGAPSEHPSHLHQRNKY
jgi:cytochrome oxidase Cu insertion factor (SCO1/SenC/PrrC family)/mono/diheme cytochrome c family protein